MSYQTSVVYCYAALILKLTAGINKNIFADCDIFSAIRIKRREKPERFVDFFSGKFREDFYNFFRCMVFIIKLCCNF